jgi:hypothetical protein
MGSFTLRLGGLTLANPADGHGIPPSKGCPRLPSKSLEAGSRGQPSEELTIASPLNRTHPPLRMDRAKWARSGRRSQVLAPKRDAVIGMPGDVASEPRYMQAEQAHRRRQ